MAPTRGINVNAAQVEAITISSATHYVHLGRPEHGRARLLAELTAFLARPAVPADAG